MKKLFITLSIAISGVVSAQNLVQAPLVNNNFLLNPAAAGFNHDLNILGGYRNAYTGIEGNPTTSILAGDFKISPKFGAGAIFGAEQIGVFKNHNLQLAGSYQLQLAEESFLNFGLQGGLFFNSIDMQSLNVESMGDQAITESLQNGMAFNLGMGAHFNWKALNLGVASGKLLSSGYKYENDNLVVNQAPDFNAYASYDIKASEDFSVAPIIGVEGVQNSPVIVSANLMVQNTTDGYQFGYGYNTNQAHSVMFGIRLKKHINLNYAYSFGGNGIMQGTGGTHELGVGVLIKSFKDLGNNKAEIDSLIGLTDSLTSKVNKLEKEIESLKAQLKAAEGNQAKIDELKARIAEKDKMIQALRAKNAQTQQPTESSNTTSDIQNGETLTKGTYYLVVESFKTEARAKKAVSNWKDQGIDLYYVQNEKGTWYYIVTAKYKNKKASQAGLASMRGALIKDAWIYLHE